MTRRRTPRGPSDAEPRSPMRGPRAEHARRAREALGLTQREWAALLGVPQSTVGRWEAGLRDPGLVVEAFLSLVVEVPQRAARVLRRLRARDAAAREEPESTSTTKPRGARSPPTAKPT